MHIYNIFTNKSNSFPEGKADLLLASSTDKSSDNQEFLLTPTLNAEFITNEKTFSLETSQEENYVSTAAIITRAIHNLNPFTSIEVLDLGLKLKPQHTTCHDLDISSSDSTRDIFAKGMQFGKSYELKGNYLIIGNNSTIEQTNVIDLVLALDFESETADKSNFERFSVLDDPLMIFYAGFLLEASRRFHIVLSGGAEMAVCLFIADKLREDVLMRVKNDNITLVTSESNIKNEDSPIISLLSQLSYTPNALYTKFDFSSSEIQELREYRHSKESYQIDVAALLAYGVSNGLDEAGILNESEIVSYTL